MPKLQDKVLTVLLIEDSAEFAELVHEWLSLKIDSEFILNWTDTLAAGLTRLERGGVDAILLDLGLPDSHGLETFTTAKAHASGVPVIVLSGGDTESLALQMVQQGAQDYIIKSTCNSDIVVKALRYAVGRTRRQTPEEAASDQNAVIGVMGAKGGMGATTFACNLAIELRRQSDQGTLVADLDVNAGLVSFLMNSDSGFSILDAISGVNRLNHSVWDGAVAHGPGGVDIIRSPNLIEVDNAQVHKIRDMLAFFRTSYRWTVLDLGRMTSLSLSLLDKLNELYLVTTLSVPALYEAKRTIGALTRAGLREDRLRLIVNQFGTTQELSGSELGGLFGVPVYAKLPAAAKELDDACAEGKLLGEGSQYRAQIAGLARKTAGLPDEKSGGPGAGLRSFAGMFRKAGKNLATATRT